MALFGLSNRSVAILALLVSLPLVTLLLTGCDRDGADAGHEDLGEPGVSDSGKPTGESPTSAPTSGNGGAEETNGVAGESPTSAPTSGNGGAEETNGVGSQGSTTSVSPSSSGSTVGNASSSVVGSAGCAAAGCNLTLEYARSHEADARFLMQATFGPSRHSLAELWNRTSYADWIKAQFDLQASSHREHYRARVNGRLIGDMGVTVYRSPCQAGSRWNAFALSVSDKGKAIRVTGNYLYVDGALRTEIDPTYSGNGLSAPRGGCEDARSQNMIKRGRFCGDYVNVNKPWGRICAGGDSSWTEQRLCRHTCYHAGYGYFGDDCSTGWASLEFDGFVCQVEEEVGGWVGLSASPDCNTRIGQENPALWFAGSQEGSDQLAFTQLKPGVLILSEAVIPCTLAETIYHGGRHYMHDRRMALTRNDLEAPSAGSAEVCPSVAKTFLNEASCQVQSTCTSMEIVSSFFILDAATLEVFFDVAEKYVYSVAGLLTTVSPCGVLSRWQKLDSRPAEITSLSAADKEAVATALQAEEGWLRDVYVQCEDVPPNAAVEIGESFFKHVHINEHNVYDFSTWVARHPGGDEAVTRWVSEGFQIEFPSSHPVSRWTDGDAGVDTQRELGFIGRLGDTVDFLALPVALQSHELALAFGAGSWTVGFQTCGSPGEVSNDPTAGHHFSFFLNVDDAVVDLDYDYSNARSAVGRLSRSTVWTGLSLRAPDQLRQRVAWALSQIFVVSTAVAGAMNLNEMWVTYYDIFVRNAFGSYRDVMREVTYSPMMGDYLSFRDSKSLDTDGRWPDENYAREIMQLFSIGLWELQPDGARKVDEDGHHIQTYSNDNIMHFARVFTGFTYQAIRANIEENSVNMIDPMQMKADRHDVYPKPDLNGEYLGDRYPLCADLPRHAFLSKGARYEFLGYDYSGQDVLVVDSGSELSASLLPFRSTVVLEVDLACHGTQCDAGGVRVVKVQDGYYQFVPPACVHLYFFNGQEIAPGGHKFGRVTTRKCAHPDAIAAGISCCDGCTNLTSSWMDRKGWTCEAPHASMFEEDCKHNEGWRDKKICQLACWEHGVGYDGDDCSGGAFVQQRSCSYHQEKVRLSTAIATCERLGLHICDRRTSTPSCGLDDAYVWTPWSCLTQIEVREDGTVSLQMDSKSKQNKISVHWQNGRPIVGACPDSCAATNSSCICPITVEARAVFHELPNQAQVRESVRIGAYVPSGDYSCLAPCSGDVKAYTQNGVIDAETIFEFDGAFFKNVQSVVEAGGFTFRNPPVFMLAEALTGREEPREALAEVESLLDHLFHHPNTAPFVSYRLIQRLVTSNPTPDYVRDVALAFSQGQFGGVVYSGKYGDLGATVAAILLHPEARGQRPEAMAGKLREPLVKIMHFLRSMEYQGANGQHEVLSNLQEVVGQFPYEAPSVFNFFSAEFQPAEFADGAVAPEFEIFTPPLALSWVNGMLSLLDYGLSSCEQGFGVNVRSCNVPEGSITWAPALAGGVGDAESDEVLKELSLLLTGGRLSVADATLAAAYEAYPDEPLEAALRAILLSAEFHTLGEPEPQGTRPEQSRKDLPEPDSYKAMVMLFLDGGADTFNLLVPLCADLYAEYVEVRQDIALPVSQLNSISAPTQACQAFGVHHRLPFVAQLYDDGQLAFASNMGSLVEPTTKEEYKAKTSRNCAGGFSHSDQTTGMQTLKCQVQGASPRGFGGRLVDALAAQGYFATSFSLAGQATWSQGFIASVEIVSGKSGVVQLERYDELQAVVGNITKIKYGSPYADEYVRQLSAALASSESLSGYLDEARLNTSYNSETKLAQQLYQVSRLIAARGARKAERDFFYVQIGGFDSHSSTNEVLDVKFQEIDSALEGFVAEMKAQSVFDSVTLVTSSEFGRTLTSNGAGTDHGWAGNYFVLGGGVRGGRVFNEFPESLLEGNSQDAGRGRLIPKYPWESVMVPVAEWLGADPGSDDFLAVFPNLANFDRADHIVKLTDLFNNYDLI